MSFAAAAAAIGSIASTLASAAGAVGLGTVGAGAAGAGAAGAAGAGAAAAGSGIAGGLSALGGAASGFAGGGGLLAGTGAGSALGSVVTNGIVQAALGGAGMGAMGAAAQGKDPGLGAAFGGVTGGALAGINGLGASAAEQAASQGTQQVAGSTMEQAITPAFTSEAGKQAATQMGSDVFNSGTLGQFNQWGAPSGVSGLANVPDGGAVGGSFMPSALGGNPAQAMANSIDPYASGGLLGTNITKEELAQGIKTGKGLLDDNQQKQQQAPPPAPVVRNNPGPIVPFSGLSDPRLNQYAPQVLGTRKYIRGY